MDRASQIAKNNLSDATRFRALAIIADARGDVEAAVANFERAIETDPRDAELRHLAAVSLYQAGNAKHAVQQARVATLLAPAEPRFREFYQRVLQIHRSQYSNLNNSVE